MDKPVSFHERLRHARLARNWTQADLAEKLDCATKTVNRWEIDQFPNSKYRQRLCELFEITAEDFGLLQKEQTTHPVEHTFSAPAISPAKTLLDEQFSISVAIQEAVLQLDGTSQVQGVREDWDEAPSFKQVYGRDQELAELQEWIDDEHYRVIVIFGMGGTGKTVLATKLAQQAKDSFEYVFWRSLQQAPPLKQILQQAVQFLSEQQRITLPKDVDDQIRLLMQYLRARRCLLVLDNVESLFQPGKKAGVYREGYEDYGRLFRRVGEMQHQSCLLLTSREKLKELNLLEGRGVVGSLRLGGIGEAAVREILKEKKLSGQDEHWHSLVNLYSGNPLALKLVAELIEEVFGGDIGGFLSAGQAALEDIKGLLNEQFQRLTAQEAEILYWLAIEREPVALEEIHTNLVQAPPKVELLEALHSLRRRSLIENWGSTRFTLQPVIMEYVTNQIVRRAAREFATNSVSTWMNYAFLKAQGQDYVRESQARFILAPLVDRLSAIKGRENLKQPLLEMLSVPLPPSTPALNYLAGNVLNLLIHIGYDLRGMDFSRLLIRQAYLQQAALPDVNFSHARFVDTTFGDTFGNIVSLAFSLDGELLAAGSATGEIRLYHAQSNTLLLTCSGHSDAVWSLAFCPDGRRLASSSDDQTVRVWDTRTGNCLNVFQEHTNRVRAVAFSPDGRFLASGSDDQTIRIWDMANENCVALLIGHTGRIWSLAFSPDGRLLASGSTDQTIRLWDVATWQCVKTIEGCANWIRSVRFHPGGHILVSCSDDHLVRLWDVENGDCLETLQGHSNRVWSVAFSHDGRLLASGSEDQTVRLWDVQTGRCLQVLQAHTHGIRTVAFNTSDSVLASGGDDQCLRLWDVKNGRCLRTLQGYTNRIWSVSFANGGQTLVSSGEDQYIRLWDMASGTCVKTLYEPSHGIRFVASSPDSRMLASCGEDETVRLWDVKSGRCTQILKGHTNWIREVVFSPDGSMLASGGEDHIICLWDVKSGQCSHQFTGHTNWVRSLAFSPDGQLLASGSDDQEIRLWNVQSGECLKVLQGHQGRVRSVAFSPDGKLIASGSEDHTIRLWDAESGQCCNILQGHHSWILSVAFSPDGKLLASGSDDQAVRLWDVQTGKCLTILRGHNGRVRSVAFHPGGDLLASGGYDGKILLWNVSTGTCVSTLIGERPYEHMDITGVQGLTEAQKATLRALGGQSGELVGNEQA